VISKARNAGRPSQPLGVAELIFHTHLAPVTLYARTERSRISNRINQALIFHRRQWLCYEASAGSVSTHLGFNSFKFCHRHFPRSKNKQKRLIARINSANGNKEQDERAKSKADLILDIPSQI
jgi:hypothetical protein